MSLKSGFTTGSAATAAAKASAIMLLSGKALENIIITIPAGKEYNAKIYDAVINEKNASCYVVKESGDDPDITAGMKIYGTVRYSNVPGVTIKGGTGIGMVTRPGLDQPVGEYAINSVPRKMITEALSEVMSDFDYEMGLEVEISAPEGEELAQKTFNPHMGIEGGISIIGTTGVVEPMSTRAILDTISLDISMQYSEGAKVCFICPGNYGVTFLKNVYGISSDKIVTCSNYVGDSLKMAMEKGFRKILFVSHIGKLIKVSGGYMNTHSKFGDHRMELMCAAYKEACDINGYDVNDDVLDRINICVSTTAALDILSEEGIMYQVSEVILKKAIQHMTDIARNCQIEGILYENNYGELAKSDNALIFMEK